MQQFTAGFSKVVPVRTSISITSNGFAKDPRRRCTDGGVDVGDGFHGWDLWLACFAARIDLEDDEELPGRESVQLPADERDVGDALTAGHSERGGGRGVEDGDHALVGTVRDEHGEEGIRRRAAAVHERERHGRLACAASDFARRRGHPGARGARWRRPGASAGQDVLGKAVRHRKREYAAVEVEVLEEEPAAAAHGAVAAGVARRRRGDAVDLAVRHAEVGAVEECEPRELVRHGLQPSTVAP